jgi:hypothetical protein
LCREINRIEQAAGPVFELFRLLDEKSAEKVKICLAIFTKT